MTKKLLFNLGGMPLYLEDLEIIQDQIRMSNRMNALFAGLHEDETIAFGTIYQTVGNDESYRSLSGQYFQYQGEIYYMEPFANIPVKPQYSPISDSANVIYIEFRQTPDELRMHNNGITRNCQATLTAHFWTYDEIIHQGRWVNNAKPDNFVHIEDIKIKGVDF